MFPLKHILLGLTGTGLVGGSVAAWQLTKNNKHKILNSTIPSNENTGWKKGVEEACGEKLKEWGSDSDVEEYGESVGLVTNYEYEKKNNKDKDYASYLSCEGNFLTTTRGARHI